MRAIRAPDGRFLGAVSAVTMKGLAAQVGGQELARLMRAADDRLKRGEVLDADTLAPLQTEYVILAAALRQWFETGL